MVVASKTHAKSERVNCVKTYENYGHAHKIKVRLLQQAAEIDRKATKISMFFGTSISEAFWEDFGKVLEDQNPRFSCFLRCFFDVKLEERFGRPKNQPKRPNKSRRDKFSVGFRSSPASWGKKKIGEQEPRPA